MPDLEISSGPPPGAAMDVAMARAALLLEDGEPSQAPAIVANALADPDAGSAGWILPIEPLLGVARSPVVWSAALARMRGRAM